MSEANVVQNTSVPLTRKTLAEELQRYGLCSGQVVLVHSSLSKLGWIPGGPETVIQALLDVLGDEGTLMMPSFTTDNSDPAYWENPPVPEEWWPVIRQWTPAYNPATTPTRMMGVIAELFRTWPGTMRSNHPATSFAARGPEASYLISDHDLQADLGDDSPLGKLYDLDGHVLLLGVGHANNTSLHLAEHRAKYPGKSYLANGAAMLVHGQRQWVQYHALNLQDEDFTELGQAFDAACGLCTFRTAQAEVRFFEQRVLVDFAVEWMEKHRS